MFKRIKDLIIKMISVKGLLAIAASIGLFFGHIDGLSFVLAWAVVIGGRTFDKLILLGSKKEREV